MRAARVLLEAGDDAQHHLPHDRVLGDTLDPQPGQSAKVLIAGFGDPDLAPHGQGRRGGGRVASERR
jgi:hypothetical protein